MPQGHPMRPLPGAVVLRNPTGWMSVEENRIFKFNRRQDREIFFARRNDDQPKYSSINAKHPPISRMNGLPAAWPPLKFRQVEKLTITPIARKINPMISFQRTRIGLMIAGK